MSDTLPPMLPCPFCGQAHTLKLTSAQELEQQWQEDLEPWMHSDTWAVMCDATKPDGPGGCGASGGFFDSEREAVDAWNRRAALAEPDVPETDFGNMSDTLPPLPEFGANFRPRWPSDEGGYTADQMREYAAAALAAAAAEPLTAQAFDELCAENDRLIKYADHCNELIAAYKATSQTEEPVLQYTGLFEYAHEHRLNYNELCKVVREACSAPKEQP